MATTRFSHLDDFTLKNSKVGIGTSDPTEALEVIGGSRSKDIKVTGIATLTSYEGFQNKKTSYVDNVNITGGESGSLSEIVIGAGTTISVGTGATSGQGNIKSLKVSNTFTPPIGGTADRPTAPQPGAIFYNKDFKTIEYWDGNFWRQVDNTTRSGRAAMLGGNHNPASAAITKIGAFNLVTGGNETMFGALAYGSNAGASCGSATRGIYTAGTAPESNTITYVTIPSLGDSTLFGDLYSVAYRMGGGGSNSTRGIFMGGRGAPGGCHNIIQYIQIQTTGNALDFGDLLVSGRGQGCTVNSTTRVFCAGNCPYTDEIQYVNIASTGNAIDFGNQIYGGGYQGGCSNSIRGVIYGGYQSPGTFLSNQKMYITMASDGNAVEFGDMTQGTGDGQAYVYSGATQTRGCILGGMDTSSSPYPSRSTVDAFNFESKGEVTVIGDLSEGKRDGGCTSDSHGGLGGF